MGEYTRRAGDKAYRRVHLFVTGVPEFDLFTQGAERVSFTDDEVLEVMDESGRTEIYADAAKNHTIYYNFPENGLLKINSDNPRICSRLWLQRKGSSVLYKLPTDLPVGKDQKLHARVNGSTADLVLVGDQYFNKLLVLTQNG